MFQDLLAKLYSLELYYKTGHWQSKSANFYGDHLLLDRLSENAGSRIDQVAEKALGITGNTSVVDLPEILKKIYSSVKNLPYSTENTAYFQEGLRLENDLLLLCKTADTNTENSVGVRNMIGDIADDSEGRVYLLKQRLSQQTKPPIP